MTLPQSMMLAEIMKTGRLIVAIVTLIGGGSWAVRGLVDGYLTALDANTAAIQGAEHSISELRTDLTSFKSDVAKEIGRLDGVQQEKDRQRRLQGAPGGTATKGTIEAAPPASVNGLMRGP